MITLTRTCALASIGTLLLVVSAGAVAADSEPNSSSGIEEIIVTAQRRSENIQTVPIAITALTSADVQRNGIHDLGTLAASVPGLTFSPFAPGQNIIALRGVSSNDDGAGTDNSVALFVDDVYLGRVSNINPELYDVDRVEVLRGPQGTLYGKNTIGGAINIVTSTPNINALDVKANVDLGNYDRHNFSALITGPMGAGWAGKLVVSTRYAEGWVNDVVLHAKEKDDNSQSVRGQLLRMGESSELLLSADYSRLNDEDMARIPLTHETNNLPFSPLLVYQSFCGASRNPSCATNPYPGYARQFADGVSAKWTDHVTPASDLISITAYRRSSNDWDMDSLGAGLALGNDVVDNTHQYSEELRWVSSPIDNLRYVTGLWFLREFTDRLRLFDLPSFPDPVPQNLDYYDGINQTTSYAAFGQADWAFADQWTFTVGGRYSYDHKHIDNNSHHGPDSLGIIPLTFANEREASWGKFTPKVSIRYEPTTAVNLYATVAQGFKSGGFAASPTSVAETNPLKPEEATNYEVGVKTELTTTIRANLALFDTHYKNLQIQSFGPPAGCGPPPAAPCFGQFETFNAGTAEARGAELEFTWLPINDLTISASYGYLNSKFTNVYLPNAPVVTLITGQVIDLRNQSGQDTLRSPRNKADVDVQYEIPLGARGALQASADYNYTADQRGELEPYAIQPAYSLINGRLSWTSQDRRYEVALWGKNLADRAWIAHVYTIADEVFGVYGCTADLWT